MADERDPEPRPKPRRWRPRLRSLHRDLGYLVVGLTFVYAASGLAVNHIEDWDPNFTQFERKHVLGLPLPVAEEGAEQQAEQAAARMVLDQLDIDEQPSDVFMYEHELEIQLDERSLFVDGEAMTILDRGQDERRLLRLANWLHLNRGKKAWTVVADGYALLLLFLATSGMLMLPGKKGMAGRGWILVVAGAAVPIAYVLLSGGP